MNIVELKQVKSKSLDFALAYAKIGWYVLPIHSMMNGACSCGKECKTPAKHPITSLVPRGFKDSTIDESVIRDWFARYPCANLAVDLAKSGLCCIDVDTRNGGLETFEMLPKTESDLHQFSGGGGFHLFYYADEAVTSLSTLGKGIDFKTNGYVLIAPSNHHTGGVYDWEASSDPLEANLPSFLPSWIIDLGNKKEIIETKDFVSRLITKEQIADLRSALRFVDCNDYNKWISAGLALKSAGAAGFEVWNEYSARSDKYDASEIARRWNSFTPNKISYASIFHEAQQNGYVNIPTAPEFIEIFKLNEIKLYSKKENITLLNLPKFTGFLGELEDYYNATSPISQPLFAKQTALAIGSVLLGRRVKTNKGHYTSLYFSCVVTTANGKEHIRTTIKKVLSETGKRCLITGDGYTSEGAVFSVLKRQPVHLSTIDEFGMYLQAANNPNNHIGAGANKALMECIGAVRGEIHSKNYSAMGVAKEVKTSEVVVNPAITLMTMTTPSTFYAALSSKQVLDGFLGRFICVQSDEPRKVANDYDETNVPESIKQWIENLDLRVNDKLNLFHGNSETIGEQVVLTIDDDALALQQAFKQEMVDLMNELEKEGMEGLAGRAGEFAQRLSLIFQMSLDVNSQSVTRPASKMAIDYMRAVTHANLSIVRDNLSSSEFERSKQEVLAGIRGYGSDGVTARDLGRKSPFSKYPQKDLQSLLKALVDAEFIAAVNKSINPAGKQRIVYLAIDDELTLN
jgi:hypothetical protein